jgi:hypothetical protein
MLPHHLETGSKETKKQSRYFICTFQNQHEAAKIWVLALADKEYNT